MRYLCILPHLRQGVGFPKGCLKLAPSTLRNVPRPPGSILGAAYPRASLSPGCISILPSILYSTRQFPGAVPTPVTNI